MIGQMQEIVSEKTQALAEQVQKLRKDSAESVREAVTGSAENLKALKSPVRLFARSGIKVTAVSQATVQSIIELQSDVITSALTDMALRLERASRAEGVIDLVKDQFEMLPATRARIGVVDRLFSRVGAADDLARGRSTFMVEMVETAAILNQAGDRSLVILDEIGRGTATFDGLSIAWAAIEHLHEANRCRTLFATHYHELTALSAKLPRMFNATVRVKEWQGNVVFLHEVLPGSADRSYGIQVAKLAGLPPAVIARAKSVLAKLEAQDRGQTARALVDDLPLFAVPSRAAAEAALPAEAEALIEAVKTLHPDEMTPREALEALYALKAKLPKQ